MHEEIDAMDLDEDPRTPTGGGRSRPRQRDILEFGSDKGGIGLESTRIMGKDGAEAFNPKDGGWDGTDWDRIAESKAIIFFHKIISLSIVSCI